MASSAQQIESVLTQLVLARKAIQFYPPKNPQIAEALGQLVNAAETFFENAGQEDRQDGEPAGDTNTETTDKGLFLQVTHEGFRSDEAEIGTGHEAVSGFARDLYRHGVKWFWLVPGASAAEFEAFLRATCPATGQGQQKSPFLSGQEDTAFDHIGIDHADALRLIAQGEGPRGMDMVDYLRQKQALRQPPGQAAEDSTQEPLGEDAEDVSDLVQFFLDVAQGSEEKKGYLFNTLTDPERLAALLTHMSTVRPAADSDTPDLPSNPLRQTLHHIADCIRSLPEDTRTEIVTNMAEAILTTTESGRETAMSESLAAGLGTGGIEDEISAALPDEQVAVLLSTNVRLHSGTADTVSNYLEEFSSDPLRRNAIRELVAQKLDLYDDDRLREVADLLKSGEISTGAQSKARVADEDKKGQRREQDRQALAREITLTPEESCTLTTQIEHASEASHEEHVALMILQFYIQGDTEQPPEKTMALLNAIATEALAAGHYPFVAELLDLVMKRAGADKRKVLQETLRPFFDQFHTRHTILKIIQAAQAEGERTPEYKRLCTLLTVIGKEAAEVVFSRIATEKVRAIRMFLLTLFLDLGKDNVAFLCGNIEHPHWFVVRNIAYLLGRFEAEEGIPALERVLHHDDMRVRREVLRALASVKGPQAESVLLSCLDDHEPVVSGLAAEWLGIMGADRVLPTFVDMLGTGHKKLRKRPELAIGLVRTVGRLGGTEEIAQLNDFASRIRGFGVRRRDDMTKACEEAVAMIQERLQQGPEQIAKD